uniref:Uncharacterized protein n=1 Tax=Chrysotila carterae TaxID=13221 RepID=A0A7S4F6Y2_CHRCT|mmetsp:Transcript_32890/g.63317  ORF Transcript_32890/g.63317 Transcript_32890/m.63317 type:complete len:241 (-) Transcript_32890:770-1492(-)
MASSIPALRQAARLPAAFVNANSPTMRRGSLCTTPRDCSFLQIALHVSRAVPLHRMDGEQNDRNPHRSLLRREHEHGLYAALCLDGQHARPRVNLLSPRCVKPLTPRGVTAPSRRGGSRESSDVSEAEGAQWSDAVIVVSALICLAWRGGEDCSDNDASANIDGEAADGGGNGCVRDGCHECEVCENDATKLCASSEATALSTAESDTGILRDAVSVVRPMCRAASECGPTAVPEASSPK